MFGFVESGWPDRRMLPPFVVKQSGDGRSGNKGDLGTIRRQPVLKVACARVRMRLTDWRQVVLFERISAFQGLATASSVQTALLRFNDAQNSRIALSRTGQDKWDLNLSESEA
jgi:hypothetical protein